MIGHININSIRNKFEMSSNCIKSDLNILTISEAKLDSTFPSNQFTIEEYVAPVRFDRNVREGGIFYTYGRISQRDCQQLLYLKFSKDFC